MDLLAGTEKGTKHQPFSFSGILSCTDDYTTRVGLSFGFNKSSGDEATDPAFASAVTVIHVELDDSVALIEVFGQDIDGRVSA